MKRIILLFTLFILLCINTVYAKIPDATANFYVNDFANVLSKETSEYIINKNTALFEATGAQIVVATVDFTDGMDMESYAKDMFNKWEIGTSDNGLLLLLSIGDDYYWATPGYKLEEAFSSGQIGAILDEYLEPDFANKNYDAGVKKTFDQFIVVMDNIYGTNISNNSVTNSTKPIEQQAAPRQLPVANSRGNGLMNQFMTIVILIFVFIIVISVLTGFGGRRRYRPTMRRRRGIFIPPPPPNHHHRNTFGGGFFGSGGGGGSFPNKPTGGGGKTGGGGAGRSSSWGGSSKGSFGGGFKSGMGGFKGGGGKTGGGGAGRH